MKNNDSCIIQLDNIDTTESAKNFSRKIQEKNLNNDYRTFFLNGPWGSGKSYFLDKARTSSKLKYVNIDFWTLKDERSAITIGFAWLHPFLYWLSQILVVTMIVISILMTDLFNLGLSRNVPEVYVIFATIIALVIAVWRVLRYKSDHIYSLMLTRFSLHRKVLVIDDFDRVTPERQVDVYKLFNILKGKLPIVFVGDHDNLMYCENKFLQKIIDEIVELPYVLHPRNIWNTYFDEITKQLDVDISLNFKKVVILEKRNLRERDYFNNIVNSVFFTHNKLGHVQSMQQLWVIYFFCFHRSLYNKLVDNERIEFITDKDTLKYALHEPISNLKMVDVDTLIQYELYHLAQNDNSSYPSSFFKNRQVYFIFEVPLNQTAKELELLFDSEVSIQIIIESGIDTDIYRYTSANYKHFNPDRCQLLFETVMKSVSLNCDSDFIRLIIREENNSILSYLKNPAIQHIQDSKTKESEVFVNEWSKRLYDCGYDLSMIFRLLIKYEIISLNDLSEVFESKLDINVFLGEYMRPEFILTTYINSINQYGNFNDWDDLVWIKINELTNEQFISFWILHQVVSVSVTAIFFSFDDSLLEKDFRLFSNEISRIDGKILKSNQFAIEKITPRILEMVNQGYRFEQIDRVV